MRSQRFSLSSLLRKSAVLRSAGYLTSMVGLLVVSSRVHRRYTANLVDHPHVIALPGVVGLTQLFARLQPEDASGWTHPPSRREYEELSAGLILGATAFGTVLAAEHALGWVSAPAWGWHNEISLSDVLFAATVTALQEVPVIVNEETVFRGYGLDALRDAYGLPGAVILSTLLFARYHGPGWRNLFSLSAFGLLLALLRSRTDSLWLCGGFHFAWNIMQLSVFGPSEGRPSVRPLLVHGPSEWVGKPGTPEWGWFGLLSVVALAALAAVELRWHNAAQQDSRR